MKDLIEALTILARYASDSRWPTMCEHDVLMVVGVRKDAPDAVEVVRLAELGFRWSDEYDCWASYRFGSA